MKVIQGDMHQSHYLPEPVSQVAKEIIKSFTHSKRVGSYLLGRTLGVGSFAKVKEGLHLTTGEKVAIKIIDKKRAKTDNYVRKNLRREGKLLQMVRHPNIISLFEVMETDNSYYLVTELCRGGDLMEYISSKKRLPESEVIKFIGQIVSAVDYLHRLGVIHRDLKIENLLLDGNKDVKLIDFGLSNFIKVANTPEGTRAQEFCVTQCGSPAYAAPELLNHEKYGLQVDLWSIGVNMYAMLTGALPFTVEPFNIKALYAKMRDRQMNPVPDDLSRECKDLLRKFLNPDPTRRVTIVEALNHPWLTQGNKQTAVRHPCPNRIRTSDLDADILSHMSENLGFRMGEVIKFVTSNTPSPACATYYLYVNRLNRYKAEMTALGQILAPSISRSPSEDSQRITLHLQNMSIKTCTEVPSKNSDPINTSPIQSLQSNDITLVDTDEMDTVTTGSSSKKEYGVITDRTINDNSLDKKENTNPLSRYNSANLINNADINSPALSEISRSGSKGHVPSIFSPRHLPLQPFKEPQNKVPTGLGVVTSKFNDNFDVGKSLIEKLTDNAQFYFEKHEAGLRKEKYNYAQLDDDIKSKTLPLPHRNTSKSTWQSKTEVISSVLEQNGNPTLGEALFGTRYKIHKMADVGNSQLEIVTADSNNNESIQHSRPRRYIPNNKLLSRRAGPKVIDSNNSAGKAEVVINTKMSTQPIPVMSKMLPKQFLPFRSAQDRPRLSENTPPHYFKHSQKSNTSESLTLHGKNLLNAAYSESSNSTPRRAISPQPKPVVIRRKLIKRHRLGELTPPGSLVIQDVDQVMTTDLFISDFAETKSSRSGLHTSPLPSISSLHTNR